MTSSRQQLTFNQEFIFSEIKTWEDVAQRYHKAAEAHYKKIRSYLTLWQFRLDENQKCDIREKLAQHLDEISDHDFVQDLDSFLEGYCFKLDKSVLPNQTPKEVKIQIQPKVEASPETQPVTQNFSEPSLDYADLDYYTMQFFE